LRRGKVKGKIGEGGIKGDIVSHVQYPVIETYSLGENLVP